MKVKNLRGTAGRRPKGYDSWLDFWQSQKKSYGNTICRNLDCDNYATVGGHVYSPDGRTSNHWYILAICSTCNAISDPYEVNINDLVRLR